MTTGNKAMAEQLEFQAVGASSCKIIQIEYFQHMNMIKKILSSQRKFQRLSIPELEND